MNKKTILLLIIALVIIGVVFTGFTGGDNKVTVTTPTRGEAVHAVYATGTVEPTVMLPLAPRLSARLMKLNADEGQKVEKGEILAQLEDTDKQSNITELEAQKLLTKRELERTTRLLRTKSIAKAEADKAHAAYDRAEAALEGARQEADFYKIIAPEDGRIIQRDGEVGQLMQAGTPIFWMSCCAPMRVTTEVDEEDIPLVEPGQKVLIRSDAFMDEIFTGTVQSITPKGDPIARSYRVRVTLGEETPLRIGMTAETNIIISERKNALLVPTSAVIGNEIWVVENGTLHKKKVKVGARAPQKTEIISGLDESAQLVIEPQDSLQEGDTVKVKSVAPEQK